MFIADDEKSVITGLQRNIKWEQLGIRICGTALSGSEAFSQIQKLNPDFALLDIRMRHAIPAIFAGVVIAGLIITLLTAGVIHLF